MSKKLKWNVLLFDFTNKNINNTCGTDNMRVFLSMPNVKLAIIVALISIN